MLKHLFLKNIVLVEEANIDFHSGLTIITGETGSGKTALIEALRLLLGERADSSKVRKGCEKASVSASFDLPKGLTPLLDEAGIAYTDEEELILSREILSTGKSRAFISGQIVPAALLQKLAPHLIDFIGQHAQVLLKSGEEQGKLVDQFGEIDLSPFQRAWSEEKRLDKELKSLLSSKETSETRKAMLEAQRQEIEEARITPGEDEALFEEYTLLANSQELLIHSAAILSSADEATEKCVEIEKHLEAMRRFDKGLEDAQKMGKEAHFQLSELTQTLQSFQGKMESDPGRLSFLEERLKTLDHLQKKYGKDLPGFLSNLDRELSSIENLDEQITFTKEALEQSRKKTSLECTKIHQLRVDAASNLGKLLSQSLQELNIPQAEVKIGLGKAPRSLSGEDAITFYLRANQGEESVPVKDSSSGGELSRILFSLKILLSNKKQPQTMVFDEIDANVGGETATIIGKKLQALGKGRQVLCITHFAQVAQAGDHHLAVAKKEQDGRTTTQIEPLTPVSKEAELLRMLGGSALSS